MTSANMTLSPRAVRAATRACPILAAPRLCPTRMVAVMPSARGNMNIRVLKLVAI